jgi:hypothetical protein
MPMECELCSEQTVLFGDDNAYVRHDNNTLSKGHVLVVPRRHVADFFDMTWAEKTSVLAMLDRAKAEICREHAPDGFNGVNIGKAGGNPACMSTCTLSRVMPATWPTPVAAFVASCATRPCPDDPTPRRFTRTALSDHLLHGLHVDRKGFQKFGRHDVEADRELQFDQRRRGQL